MIRIIIAPVFPFIPVTLLNELVDVQFDVVEENNNEFIVYANDVISGLQKLGRNYAAYYYEKTIHFFCKNGVLPISKEFVAVN